MTTLIPRAEIDTIMARYGEPILAAIDELGRVTA